MGAGRPTKYRDAYCGEVIAAGEEGLSLTAFAGTIGVSRDTVNEWTRVHPEFSDAIKIHQAKRTAYLERTLLSAEQGPRVTARIFALKNAAPEEWSDTTRHEHSGRNGSPITVIELTAPPLSLPAGKVDVFLEAPQ